MKPSPAQQLQKTQQALAHERAMREVLQLVNRRDFPDKRHHQSSVFVPIGFNFFRLATSSRINSSQSA